MDAEALVVDAFAQLGVDVVAVEGGRDSAVDLVMEPGGVRCNLEVKYRSLISEDIAIGMIEDARGTRRAGH